MKFSQITRILFLLALSLSFVTRGSASSVEGKVIEVLDGERISILSLNHLLKIKLLGVAVPAKGQPYDELARQHLADLVSSKFVVVRYTGLGHDTYLIGTVLLENADVGEQMIRDGVAWYDQSDSSNLTQEERQLYAACEQAARLERRGLWHDESPTPPWKFREAQSPHPRASAPSLTAATPLPGPLPRPRRSAESAVSNKDLMRGITPGSPAGKPVFKRISENGVPGKWSKFQPEGAHFSILAPSDGVEVTYPIIDAQAKLIDIHFAHGESNGVAYVLLWLKGFNDNSTDESATMGTLEGLLKGMNQAAQPAGQGTITAKASRILKLSGYSGKQFTLSGPLSGVVRIFSKQVGDQRELFLLGVLNSGDDEGAAADHFFNSFKISEK
jgi:micrococcal nuclease